MTFFHMSAVLELQQTAEDFRLVEGEANSYPNTVISIAIYHFPPTFTMML